MVDHGDDRGAPDGEGQADGGPAGSGGERVAKALARAGVASRRDVERYIAAGRVALNGRVLDTPAVKVEPGDVLTVDGAVVGGPEATRVWRHHKPAGLITSHGDPAGRPTVFAHLPPDLPRVISIGRLDLATEGLLLLTNDGELARRLELPDNGWRRVYRARAHGRADQARLDTLRDGVTIEGVRYGPVEARLDKATGKGAVGRGRVSDAPANLWITVTVAEGKNREVRRVLEHLGLKVNRLIRLAYGPFALGELQAGEVEEVSPRVLREQLGELIAPGSMPNGNRRPGPPTRGAPPPAVAPAVAARAPAAPQRPTGRSARPQGPAATRAGPASGGGRAAVGRGADDRPRGKPGPRPSGAAGRVSGAWTPPAARKGRVTDAAKRGQGGAVAAAAPAGGRRDAAAEARADPRVKPSQPARRFGAKPAAPTAPARPAPAAPGRPAPPAAGRKGGSSSAPRPAPPPAARKGGPPSPASPRGGGKPGSGRSPAGGRSEPVRPAGMELAPPMRRGPRKPGGGGPRRPPRGGG